MSTRYNTQSVYRNTSVVDGRYLDVLEWPMPDLSEQNLYTFELKSKHEHRPDVLAQELYGDSRLWWVFATLNPDNIQDPILDFKSGMTINVLREFK